MPMTNVDQLATPKDMVEILRALTTVLRDVEGFPEAAQPRFWDEVDQTLRANPEMELRLNEPSKRTVRVLYALLVNLCGPQLNEMVNGEMKEYYETLVAQLRDMSSKQSDWDVFLEQAFAATRGTDHEGCLPVAITIHTVKDLGRGTLRVADEKSGLLAFTRDLDNSRTVMFSSKDIITLELGVFADPPPAA